MEWSMVLALVIAALVVLFPAIFIWSVCVGGLCAAVRGKSAALSEQTCSIDADCPSGYRCVNGRCMPQRA